MSSPTSKPIIYSAVSAFPNPTRLRLFLAEKNVTNHFQHVLIDMLNGEHKKWPHLKKNPWGEVPVLTLPDGSYLSETAAIVRYIDTSMSGSRLVTGSTAVLQALDMQWEERIRIHILLPILTMAHVSHALLGPKVELTHNPQWGEHARKQALAGAAQVDQLLSDGRQWLLNGAEPTFADITLCATIACGNYPVMATSLNERFEYIDQYWQRWQKRPSFRSAYSDGYSGMKDIDDMLAAHNGTK